MIATGIAISPRGDMLKYRVPILRRAQHVYAVHPGVRPKNCLVSSAYRTCGACRRAQGQRFCKVPTRDPRLGPAITSQHSGVGAPPDGGSQSSKRSGTARLHGSGTPAIPSVDLAALALPVAAAAAIFRFNIGHARRPDGFMHLRHPTPFGEHDLTRRGGFEPGLGDKEE
jgi:hypothetical protein